MRALLLLAVALLAAPATAQRTAPPPPPPPPPPTPSYADGVFAVVEQMPELIGGLASIQPVYPELERRAGVQGRVFLQFIVNEDGSVSDIVVTRGVSPGLDAAAVAALRPARFTPGIQRGRPVRVRFSLPINFRLTDTFYSRSVLALRVARSERSGVLTRIPPGTEVEALCADGWCEVSYGGFTGYVPQAGLTNRPPAAQPRR